MPLYPAPKRRALGRDRKLECRGQVSQIAPPELDRYLDYERRGGVNAADQRVLQPV